MIPSVSQSALTGIQRGLQQTTNAASNIASVANANGETGPAELVSQVSDLKLGQRQVEVSAKVLQVEDEIRGSLLDIRA